MPFRIERDGKQWADYDDYTDAWFALEGAKKRWPQHRWDFCVFGHRDLAEMSCVTWKRRMQAASDPEERARCQREWFAWLDRLKIAESGGKY